MRYLAKLTKPANKKTIAIMFSEAVVCNRNRTSSARQGFKFLRTTRGQWFFEGEKVKRNRGKSRLCSITISGVAFPVRRGRLRSYGDNTAPNFSLMQSFAFLGNHYAAECCIGYDKWIESHNKRIDNAKEYYREHNRYHKALNPSGTDSRWREVE